MSNKAAGEELARFEGTWRFVAGEADQRTVPAVDLSGASMVIKGNRASIAQGGQTLEVVELRVNPATQPKQIDAVELEGPYKGAIALGIYELDGDSLRICQTWRGRTERPENFEIEEGSRLVLVVWKRDT
jgi:uncharacterized protein (TIGR03067 family)